MKLYAISELGADERMFLYLKLQYELIPIPWLTPEKSEPIEVYAKRMAEKINMKTVFKILTLSILISSCSLRNNSNQEIIKVVTKKEEIDKYVGELITIKGKITNTKIRTIIGIDVGYNGTIEEGIIGIATGILRKRIVTDAEPHSANRGNGIFYWLQQKRNKYVLAEAEIIKENNK